jgi:hypothetical protein
MDKVNKLLKSNARKAKIIFDLCEKRGEGIYNKLHIINTSQYPDEKKEYRIYHADGYCFDVSKEKLELDKDEVCLSCIKGYEYLFNEGIYDGFNEISEEEAIKLLEAI